MSSDQALVAQDIAPVVNAEEAPPGNQFQLIPFIKSIATRIIIFYVSSLLIKNFIGSRQPTSDSNLTVSSDKIYSPSMNMFGPGESFDFYMYLSAQDTNFRDFDDETKLIWKESNLIYGDWASGENNDGSLVKSLTISTPPELKNNESIYLHVFIAKSGQSHIPRSPNYGGREIIYGSVQLNKYKKKYYKRTANLLTGKTEQSEHDLIKADQMKYEILNFWHPNITINLVTDFTTWTRGKLPSPLDVAVKFDPATNRYYPILFFNTYWNLGTDYQIVNETVENINFTITYSPLSLFKWQLYASQQMQGKWSNLFGGEIFDKNDDDQDAIKQALLETNPMLLAVTMIVSILHTVFEFLAFKNDIQFWRSRKSLEGLSVRTVLFNVFQSVIVFLYIFDNDSSWIIKISIGFSLIIEVWKIPKCLNVEIDRENKYFGVIPKLKFTDKGSYVESATKEYDQIAFKYLSWALFPLLGCYAIYSLIYEEQRGWYSWILGMLYGFLLTFGFIMMTPQLFINYKLKSVAHLPWRMLTYKFINTFIDDLFAFVIRMPTMYRLGCFRDDIIFLVYIYQRWIYRVDPTRINEFGTSMDEGNEKLALGESSTTENGSATNEVMSNEMDDETKKTK